MSGPFHKETVRGLPLPWRVKKALGAFDEAEDPDCLFDGDDTAFKARLADSTVYAEYGVGKSTQWVLRHTTAKILAVDSDARWIEHVTTEVAAPDRFHPVHVDLGPLGDWGHPRGYSKRENFQAYTDSPWQQDQTPDTVLIDGRFRVCCFLTSLKHARAGTRLIFDDYAERGKYHLVEEFVTPYDRDGRQAHFAVPDKGQIDLETVDKLIERFRYVMD